MSKSLPCFCCNDMEQYINQTNIIFYNDIFDEYGICFSEDDASYLVIQFCPWCGKRLPLSQREMWFEKLEELGYENPLFDESIPDEFKSSLWRHNIEAQIEIE